MLNLKALAAAAVTVVVVPGAALAEPPAGMHEKGTAAFKKADTDNDGRLSREEAKAMPRVSKNFDAIDADKDGTVSLDEIHAFMKAQQKGGGQ